MVHLPAIRYVMVSGMDIESQIRDIISGRWFVKTNSTDPTRKFLVMRHPTLKELQFCDFHKDIFMEENRDILMSSKEAESKAFIYGVWNPIYETNLEALMKQVADLEKQIEEFDNMSQKVVAYKACARSARRQLNRLSGHLNRLSTRKHTVFSNTLEYNAEKRRLYCLVGWVTEHIGGTMVWHNGNIADEQDFELLDTLSCSYLEHYHIDTAHIRAVARSNYWRYRWAVGKNNIKLLFSRDIADLSIQQHELVFWSEIYESAIESYEPPPDFVIENDTKFDEWLEKKGKEREKEREKSFYKFDDFVGNENFVMVDGYYDNDGYWCAHTQEEKDRITSAAYGCNAPLIRGIQKRSVARIDQHGGTPVKEQVLRRGHFKVLGWDRIPEK